MSKTKLFFILLFISTICTSQNWEQLGSQQFTNNASNGGIGFNPSTGATYMAYIDTDNNNNVRVMEFDGVSWVNLGGLVSSDDAISPSVNVNPVTNEVWVAYIRTSDDTLSVYNYDGINWSAVGSGLGNGNLIDSRTRIRFNGVGVPRISARNTGGSTQFFRYLNSTWNFTTAFGQASDLTSYEKSYVAINHTGCRFDINTVSNDYCRTNLYPPNTVRNINRISGIDDMNYVSYLDTDGRARVWFNNTNLLTNIAGNGSVEIQLRRSSKDGNIYFVYSDVNNQFALEKINAVGNSTTTMVAPNIPTNANAFFADIDMNPVTGDYYILYKDGTKISVKKYNVETLPSKYYVSANATGNNDGSSWADAYTDLNDALNSFQNNIDIWVTGGTYKPSTSNRSAAFNVFGANINIYGGFAGTETQLSDRVLGTNETILSGDLQGNDSNVTNFLNNYTNTTRNADNSYHVIKIAATGNNLLLDGLTISDAHNNFNTTSTGGAIIKDNVVADLTLRNCIVEDNVSRNFSAGLFADFSLSNTSGSRGSLVIDRCQFTRNMSRGGSGLYSIVRADTNIDITITNSVFDHNVTDNLGVANQAVSGSSIWLRSAGGNSDAVFNIYNNTFTTNSDTGTDQLPDDRFRATLAIGKNGNFANNIVANVANCIFWVNTGRGDNASTNGLSRAISDTFENSITAVNVYNSLDLLNFVEGSITSATNTVTSNPLFANGNNDFTLTASSPAIDTGDNTYIFGNEDLLGNQRIFNTTVDMGAYEFGSTTLGIEDNVSLENFRLYPNPVRNTLNIQLEENIERVEVYSILGNKIVEYKSSSINVSSLSSGIYLLKVYTQNGKIGVKRFVKD